MMPKEFEANTLEEAYEKASLEFECSIVDLQIDIVQTPSSGFLGFFKKTAIIKAKIIKKNQKYKHHKSNHKRKELNIKSINDVEQKPSSKKTSSNKSKQIQKENIFSDFYDNKEENDIQSSIVIKKDKQEMVDEISKHINDLFAHLCYDIEPIKVEIFDENTIYIEFNGADSALLIGKEGYRYKALSYILFNWINEKYNMMLRLEVAQFLSNQEQSIYNYLEPVIAAIKEEGFYKTKPLDGILVHIALTKLREEFPNKYVAIKTNQNNEKYILVNEYRN